VFSDKITLLTGLFSCVGVFSVDCGEEDALPGDGVVDFLRPDFVESNNSKFAIQIHLR